MKKIIYVLIASCLVFVGCSERQYTVTRFDTIDFPNRFVVKRINDDIDYTVKSDELDKFCTQIWKDIRFKLPKDKQNTAMVEIHDSYGKPIGLLQFIKVDEVGYLISIDGKIVKGTIK